MTDSGNNTSDSARLASARSRRLSLIAALATFLLLAALIGSFIRQRYNIIQSEQKRDALEAGNKIKNRLQAAFTYSMASAKTLALFVDGFHGLDRFDTIADQLVNSSPDIDAVQVLPSGTIEYVYPTRSYGTSIGHSIFFDPVRGQLALQSKQTRESFFVGPFRLRQGEMGIASYQPIFHDSIFWGFTGVITKLNTLLQNAGIDSTGKGGYYFGLKEKNNYNKTENIIVAAPASKDGAERLTIEVPNGEWELTVVPRYHYMGSKDLTILYVLGAILSILGAVVIYHFVRRPHRLNELVKERTRQLIESEENYRALFEKSPLPLWIYDVKTLRFVDVNEAAQLLYGYTADEFKAMTVLDIRTPEEIDEYLEDDAQDWGDGLREAGVWTHVKKNRELIRVLIFSRKLKYKKKDAKLVLLMDISEKERMQEELSRSEEQYRMLIEQASDAIVLYAFDGTIYSFNKSACEQTGYSADEFAGLNMHDLFIESKPDPLKSGNPELSVGKGTTLYRWMKRKDGSELIVELNARLLADGKILAIIRDITEREKMQKELKASEERFSTSFHSSAMALSIVSDDEGRIVDANMAYRKLLALKENVIGKTSEEAGLLFHAKPLSVAAHREEIRSLLDSDGRIEKYEMDIVDEDGAEKTILFAMEPISIENKAHWLMSAIDVTKERKREQEIRFYNDRFLMIAAATNDVIWDHDFITNKTWGNQRLYDLYGVESGTMDINFETFADHLHPDDRPGVLLRMNDAISLNKDNVSEHFRFRMPDGSYRNFFDRALIKYDGHGKAVRIVGAMQDITDAENAKKRLIKEKSLADSIIKSLPGIFYLYNSHEKFIRWNKNFEIITGYTPEELAEIHPTKLFPESYREIIQDNVDKALGGAYQQIEADLVRKDGSRIPFYFNGEPIVYEGEHCVLGIGLDLSEQMRAQQEIIERENRYRELIEQASDAIIISNAEGDYVEVNSSACRLLGYSKEELLSMKASSLMPSPDAEYHLRRRLESLRSSSDSVIGEFLLKRKDGVIVQVETHSKMLPDGRFIAFIRDLSERKKVDKAIRESEERYRALVEHATEVLMLYDIESRLFVNVSESAGRLFDRSSEELMHCGFAELSPPMQPQGKSSLIIEEKLQQALKGEKICFDWNFSDSKGNIIPCETWFVRLPGPKVLIRTSIRDISERKKYEEELKRSSEQLRELYNSLQNVREEERKHIAREIHDELGQQLTGLKMDLYWINRRLQTEDKAIADKMDSTLKLIDQTIRSVRKIATELRPSILDDLGLIPALEWQAEEFEKRSYIKVNFINDAGDILIHPNIATALFRIFQELLTNVGRHSGATLVEARAFVKDSRLFLEVKDNGRGFDPVAVEEKKTLGLTGMKERSNLIDGTYEVETAPGKGTRVMISVPLISRN